MTEYTEPVIQQTTMMLPYFDYEVPVLCLEDGTRYIPVVALCKMLGLRSDIHIPRWRKLMLWCNARKLPWRTPTGQTRYVWCLHLGALPFLCCCFNWSLVTPLRQAQLRQATDAWDKITEQAHEIMLTEYRQVRSFLYEFLEAYMDADSLLSRLALSLSPFLERLDNLAQFEKRVAEGRNLIQEATDHARNMLYAQASMPIMDVVRLTEDGQVAEEIGSQPLFPVIPHEERVQLFAYLDLLSVWHREFVAFLKSTDTH